jgi:hypothetical protein
MDEFFEENIMIEVCPIDFNLLESGCVEETIPGIGGSHEAVKGPFDFEVCGDFIVGEECRTAGNFYISQEDGPVTGSSGVFRNYRDDES